MARMVFGANGLPSPAYFVDALASGRVTSADVAAAAAELADGSVRPATSSDELAGWTVTRTESVVDVNRQVAKWCAAFLSAKLPGAPVAAFYPSWHAHGAVRPGHAGASRSARAGASRRPARPCRGCHRLVSRRARPRSGRDGAPSSWPSWPRCQDGRHMPSGGPVGLLRVRRVPPCISSISWPSGSPTTPSGGGNRPARSASAAPRSSSRRTDVHDPRSVPGSVDAARASLASMDRDRVGSAWLLALERHYRDELLGTARTHGRRGPPGSLRPGRVLHRRPFRGDPSPSRNRMGNYETFGFAGFFALPLRYTALGAEPVDLLPVLLSPTVDMEERAAVGQEPRRSGAGSPASRSGPRAAMPSIRPGRTALPRSCSPRPAGS